MLIKRPFFTSLLFATSFPFRLFEEHGELLGLFNKFRELKTKEQQASSEELGEHANKVMETLDEGIRSLDELDTFFGFLHQVGASHTRIPDFKSEYFWVSSSLSLSGLFIYMTRNCNRIRSFKHFHLEFQMKTLCFCTQTFSCKWNNKSEQFSFLLLFSYHFDRKLRSLSFRLYRLHWVIGTRRM